MCNMSHLSVPSTVSSVYRYEVPVSCSVLVPSIVLFLVLLLLLFVFVLCCFVFVVVTVCEDSSLYTSTIDFGYISILKECIFLMLLSNFPYFLALALYKKNTALDLFSIRVLYLSYVTKLSCCFCCSFICTGPWFCSEHCVPP